VSTEIIIVIKQDCTTFIGIVQKNEVKMSTQSQAHVKKFGTFAGVYTPAILTILGVIMYLRLGWVIGSVGLVQTIVIIILAHVATVTTGLSIASLATNTKVGAGGFYAFISRSLGVEAGWLDRDSAFYISNFEYIIICNWIRTNVGHAFSGT
jgi:amino acid transporter